MQQTAAEMTSQRAKSKEQRAKSKEQRAKSKEQRAKSKDKEQNITLIRHSFGPVRCGAARVDRG
jgi:hypothetical protein